MEPISVAEHFQGSLLDCDWLKVLEVKVLSQREGKRRFKMAAHSPLSTPSYVFDGSQPEYGQSGVQGY